MDQNQDNAQHAMNNDDELAKVLEGGLQFEETPVPGAAPASQQNDGLPGQPPANDAPGTPTADATPAPSMDPLSSPTPAPATDTTPPPVEEAEHAAKVHTTHHKTGGGSSELDKLKSSALDELRPLVGKLDLGPEEKFDTLLLIIRSTDDQSLLDEAHEAAKNITDDAKRAQALLDIIKEVDYFANKK